MIEDRALLIEERALLIEDRAYLIEYHTVVHEALIDACALAMALDGGERGGGVTNELRLSVLESLWQDDAQVCQKSPRFNQKSPRFNPTSPDFHEKSPGFRQKSPGFHQ